MIRQGARVRLNDSGLTAIVGAKSPIGDEYVLVFETGQNIKKIFHSATPQQFTVLWEPQSREKPKLKEVDF